MKHKAKLDPGAVVPEALPSTPEPAPDAPNAPHPPPQRTMTIIAQDPSVRRGKNGPILMAKINIPAEDLTPGPMGYRVHVVDYDSTKQQYFGAHELPASLDDEPKEWAKGSSKILDDHRFHAQNVYALVMKTLARFERALGRRLGWSFWSHQIKIAPHGMLDANAFYAPTDEGLVFGYFRSAKSKKPVHTCLSHDVVVHETTHALIDGLRSRYLDPSNPDQAAFHEGFSDVIAILSVFALPEVIEHLMAPSGAKGNRPFLIPRAKVLPEMLRQSALFGLAEQMGSEMEGIRGGALRRSATLDRNPKLIRSPEYLEPHRRGEIFVAAVMNGFINAWSERILRPDRTRSAEAQKQTQYTLRRVAEEGADIADDLATMWIRALDYMPPVHLEFKDALSAALTADYEVRPGDERYRLRDHMTKSFRRYGIRPASNRKTPPGIWMAPKREPVYDRVRFDSMRYDRDEVFRFIWENRELLELRNAAYTKVLSVRPCTRIEVDGFVLRETIAEYYQMARLTPDEMVRLGIKAPRVYLAQLAAMKEERERRRAERRAKAEAARAAAARDGDEVDEPADDPADEPPEAGGDAGEAADDDDFDDGTPLYGGGVLVFSEYGRLKYWIHNDVFGSRQSGRLEHLWKTRQLVMKRDSAEYKRARLSSLHRRRARGLQAPQEGW